MVDKYPYAYSLTGGSIAQSYGHAGTPETSIQTPAPMVQRCKLMIGWEAVTPTHGQLVAVGEELRLVREAVMKKEGVAERIEGLGPITVTDEITGDGKGVITFDVPVSTDPQKISIKQQMLNSLNGLWDKLGICEIHWADPRVVQPAEKEV